MPDEEERKNPPRIIANYRLGFKLGAGFSGAIYHAKNIHTDQVVALKLQPIDEPCPTNRYERSFYPVLQGGKGMPTLWATGTQGPWDYLAIDLLGRSLDSLHRELMMTQDVWDLRSVCCIAIQVIDRLRFMHGRGILHRDIQLGNCVLGLQPNHQTIYMIDFGFSKFFIDPRTRRHIPDSREPRDFIGNYWFSSVRVHCHGRVPTRRDDMEALALMLIHLLTPGGLHWTRKGVPKTDADGDRLINEKRKARPEDLCCGLPPVFEDFLRSCRRLQFTAMPDYQHWIDEFRDLADEHGLGDVEEFVWPSPFPEPTVRVTAAPKPTVRMDMDELKNVLNGIAHMQLGPERQVLAERHNLVNRDSPRAPEPHAKGKDTGKAHKPEVISSGGDSEGSDENARARGRNAAAAGRLTKAARLGQLAREMEQATDNWALGRLVRAFADVMQENRSKMLTKEGFAVLDALHKQLADPSVFVAPLRTANTRVPRASGGGLENVDGGVLSGRETRQGKMNKLYRLAVDVRGAGSNSQLAGMVAEFGKVIDKSSGRTVTKDGFSFLNALAERIELLS